MTLPATRAPHRPTRVAESARFVPGPPRPRWMDDRTDLGCRQPGVDPDWWYAPEGHWGVPTTTSADADRAVALCGACPMRLACRVHGLRYEHWGLWGGIRPGALKPADRRTLLAQLERKLGRAS